MCVEAGVHVDTKQLLSNFEAEIAWILKQPEAEPKNGVAYKKKRVVAVRSYRLE